MKIERQVAVHEVGHLVVGLHLGIDEQGIVFRTGNSNEVAQAWLRNATPLQLLLRSFAGILAHLAIFPESLEPHLRAAYGHSVIFTPAHPHFDRLTPEERDFLSGARTDIALARSSANTLYPQDVSAASKCLSEAEHEARDLVRDNASRIQSVTDDVYVWAAEPDREFDVMLLYPPHRARAIIQKG